MSLYRSDLAQIHQLWVDIQSLMSKEETMWKQGSRVEWLKEGDRNTRYFHCRANQRNKRSHVLGFEDEVGEWIEEEGRMEEMVEEYLANIFTTSNPSGFDEVLEGMLPTVTKDINLDLNRPFMVEEVQSALHQMAPLIAPGPDDISPIFYKSFWHIVGNDVTIRTYVIHLLRTYVTILCNWLIL